MKIAAVDMIEGVVWGVGDTEETAKTEAAESIADAGEDVEVDDLEYHPVTSEQIEEIVNGNVEWPIVKIA